MGRPFHDKFSRDRVLSVIPIVLVAREESIRIADRYVSKRRENQIVRLTRFVIPILRSIPIGQTGPVAQGGRSEGERGNPWRSISKSGIGRGAATDGF